MLKRSPDKQDRGDLGESSMAEINVPKTKDHETKSAWDKLKKFLFPETTRS